MKSEDKLSRLREKFDKKLNFKEKEWNTKSTKFLLQFKGFQITEN